MRRFPLIFAIGARDYPAVHIAVAKKKGTNAITVARAVEQRLKELRKDVLPAGVYTRITRNYGETANQKVNELVEGLAVAIVIVIALVALTLGWREGLIIATAVPLTLDPIFSGLAWALIFGLFVSTVFTLVVIPVVYRMAYGCRTT